MGRKNKKKKSRKDSKKDSHEANMMHKYDTCIRYYTYSIL